MSERDNDFLSCLRGDEGERVRERGGNQGSFINERVESMNM